MSLLIRVIIGQAFRLIVSVSVSVGKGYREVVSVEKGYREVVSVRNDAKKEVSWKFTTDSIRACLVESRMKTMIFNGKKSTHRRTMFTGNTPSQTS